MNQIEYTPKLCYCFIECNVIQHYFVVKSDFNCKIFYLTYKEKEDII